MDSFREFPDEPDLAAPPPAEDQVDRQADVAMAIGSDERRMHVRAYNHWVSLLEGRDFPSIEDLEPGDVTDFSGHSVLLDFTCGRDNPAIPYIGGAIRDECGLDDDTRTISDIPGRSLLSRLTDHYMQIIANRAPVGFEAEFVNQRGDNICYRGILMPFSSDGEMIDFIYGVINWKRDGADFAAPSQIVEGGDLVELPDLPLEQADADHREAAHEEIVPDADAGLSDLLVAARETAEAVKAGEGRTRAALYQALSLAYDFALAGRDSPEDFAELLADSGVKAQARAPMTPVVKLVFGIDYDKARLTEFSAALSYADRQSLERGDFARYIAGYSGGLKALVAAERQLRRPQATSPDHSETARAALRSAPAISLDNLVDVGEFALIVVRWSPGGGYEPVAMVDDESLVERSIRKAA